MNCKIFMQDKILPVLAALLTIYALIFDAVGSEKELAFGQLAKADEHARIMWTILAAAVFALYRRARQDFADEKFQPAEASLAAFFACAMLVGKSFSLQNNWNLILGHGHRLPAFAALVGWGIFFYALLLYAARWWEKHLPQKETEFVNQQKQWLIYFGIILLCWLPYLIVYFPGNVPYDGMRELCMWFGYRTLTTHDPYLPTAIFGTLMQIGKAVSNNAGIFLIVLLQNVLGGGTYAYLATRVYKWCGKRAAWCTVAFFALVPMWGSYASFVLKDTMFFAAFALYFCSFVDVYELCREENAEARPVWIRFVLTSILLCLLRNDGIFRIVPAALLLFMVIRNNRKKFAAAMGITLCVVLAYNAFIFNVLGVEKGKKAEAFSLLFQQTARYSRDCGKDVTKEERKVLDKIWERYDGKYRGLGKIYKENISDPVKDRVNFYSACEYLKLWAKMGMRHPGVYAQAALNISYKYFYPFGINTINTYHSYIKDPKKVNGVSQDCRDFNDIHYMSPQNVRNKLTDYVELWRFFPGVSLLSNPGSYTWLVLWLALLLLKKKRCRELAVLSAAFLQIAVCVASPVNGLMRYALPLKACTPLMLAWCAHVCAQKDETAL